MWASELFMVHRPEQEMRVSCMYKCVGTDRSVKSICRQYVGAAGLGGRRAAGLGWLKVG